LIDLIDIESTFTNK